MIGLEEKICSLLEQIFMFVIWGIFCVYSVICSQGIIPDNVIWIFTLIVITLTVSLRYNSHTIHFIHLNVQSFL